MVVFISAEYAGRRRGPGWSGGPRWPGRWPRPGCTCSPPGSMTASCPGCCPTWLPLTCVGSTPEQFAGLVADRVAGLAATPPRRGGTGPAAAGWPLAEVRDPFDAGGAPADAACGCAAWRCPPCCRMIRASMTRCWARWCTRRRAAAAGSQCSSAGPRRARPGPAGRHCSGCRARTRRGGCGIQLTRPAPMRRTGSCRASGPRTVVWLNEAQSYLDPADGGLGERVAAGLWELLRDPDPGPGTGPGHDVAAVLGHPDRPPGRAATIRTRRRGTCRLANDIPVPAAFTPAQAAQLAGNQGDALAGSGSPSGGPECGGRLLSSWPGHRSCWPGTATRRPPRRR